MTATDQQETEVDTVPVVVGWDAEHERAYVYAAGPGAAEGTHCEFDAAVPAALWQRLAAATTEAAAAEQAVIAAARFDADHGRMRACCPTWVGQTDPPVTWWCVRMRASGRDDQWPVKDVGVTTAPTREDAEAWVAAAPEQFWVLGVGSPGSPVQVERSQLYVTQAGMGSVVSPCQRCGWSRDDHDQTTSGRAGRAPDASRPPHSATSAGPPPLGGGEEGHRR